MTLDILIPQYKEDDVLVKRLLDSIAIQQHIDFGQIKVIICNDGSNVHLSKDMLHSYPFTVEYYLEPHEGVSATRNACLRRSTADYVMFCDADDKFYGEVALQRILSYVNKGFDTLRTYFIQETGDAISGIIRFNYRTDEHQFIHGRVYNRQFLISNNLYWKEHLIYCEDYYYSKLCTAVSKNHVICPYFVYQQQFRSDSVTHQEPDFFTKHYSYALECQDELLTELLSRNLIPEAYKAVTIMMIDTYFIVNFMDKQHLISTQIVQKYFLKYKNLWNEAPLYDKIIYFKESPQPPEANYKKCESWINNLLFDFL